MSATDRELLALLSSDARLTLVRALGALDGYERALREQDMPLAASAAKSVAEPFRELLGVEPSTAPYVVPGDI